MLSPKRVKYRKRMRGKVDGVAHRGNTLAFGDFGLMLLILNGSPIARSRLPVSL